MEFSGRHYPKDLILQTVRWYLRYNLSYRDMEEILEERGVEIDHTTPYRWVQEYAPQLEAEHRKRRKVCGTSWRMDETYIKVKGEWVYLYRAVDKEGDTVDFLLTKKRDKKAATRFFKKAIRLIPIPFSNYETTAQAREHKLRNRPASEMSLFHPSLHALTGMVQIR